MSLHSVCLLLLLLWIHDGNPVGVKRLVPDNTWTPYKAFGQLSAVSVDKTGRVYVFHRGQRVWDQETFRLDNRLRDTSHGPIHEHTIIVLSPKGEVISETGKDMFYLPHGLTVDEELNLWVTDVGLHQVMKFPPIQGRSLSAAFFTLGTPLTPGKGKYLFCKPTSVAIDSNTKDFFVADGYCNSRIVKYDKDGRFLMEWGKPTILTPFTRHLTPYSLLVPHSLTIDNLRGYLIVADRENSRILSYTFDGYFVSNLETKGRVYGVHYSPVTDELYAVEGSDAGFPGVGFVFSFKSNNISQIFGTFKNAHDVASSHDGSVIYAVETDPHLIWKFTVGSPSSSSEETKIRRVNPVGSPPQTTANQTSVPGEVAEIFQKPRVPESGGSEPADVPQGPFSLDARPANQIALSVATSAVLLTFVAIICHLRRKKADSSIEQTGLILGDNDDDEY